MCGSKGLGGLAKASQVTDPIRWIVGNDGTYNSIQDPAGLLYGEEEKTSAEKQSEANIASATEATAAAKITDAQLREEAKQKQLDAARRSRKSTILTNTSSSSTGAKTLLGQ